jgi:NAD(P)-dependent dehydrogenase (short-subunit alcohol dehydrogenase family)
VSTIVLGPAEALSRALADEFGGVTVIDGPGAAGDTMWQALVALQAAHAAMAGAYPWAESATPERDIGAAVAFLVGPAARYITGETLGVDGGHFMNL